MRLLILFTALLLLQAPQPADPDYVGDEDPQHKGQPRTCSNSPRIVAVKRDCPCQKTTPEQCNPQSAMEDSRCVVFCRKPACKCHHDACETE